MRVVYASLRLDGQWVEPGRGGTPFRRHVATWGLDALQRGEWGHDARAVIVAFPSGEDSFAPWFDRWLTDMPATERNRVVEFAAKPTPHDRPLLLAAGAHVTGVEMQIPILLEGQDGAVLVSWPFRVIQQDESRVTFVSWVDPVLRVGREDALTPDAPREALRAPRSVDFGVWMHLRFRSSDADGVEWLYVHEVAQAIHRALDTADAMIDRLERSLLASPDEADLVPRLERVDALRRAVPAILECLGPHRDLGASPPLPYDELLLLDETNINRVSARIADALQRAERLDERVRRMAELVSQVATGLQLVRAREDSERTRVFQNVVTYVAAGAVVPGLIAAWAQAAKVDISGSTLAALMIAAALVTALALRLTLPGRSDV